MISGLKHKIEQDDIPLDLSVKKKQATSLIEDKRDVGGDEKVEKVEDTQRFISRHFDETGIFLKPLVPPLSLSISEKLLSLEWALTEKLRYIQFQLPVEYVYNPIEYAFDIHARFVRKYCQTTKKILFLGMNPGPWGMSQTGVPFGEVKVVRDWFKLTGYIGKPYREQPDRQVTGFACTRSEISGKRFWALFRELCETPENFFRYAYLHNYCPIALMDDKGRNITPAELKGLEQKALHYICDEALVDVVKLLKVDVIVGIGRFAEKRAQTVVKMAGLPTQICCIPHPSPRSVDIGYFIATMDDIGWMDIALDKANDALQAGEVPVGCLFVYNNEIIATGRNTVNETRNATRHAELNCIDQVLDYCQERSLNYNDVFRSVNVIVTVEPCIMCAAALHQLNVRSIVYGCHNDRFGGCASVFDVPKLYHSNVSVTRNVKGDEAMQLLKDFYKGTNPNAPVSKVKKGRKKKNDTHTN